MKRRREVRESGSKEKKEKRGEEWSGEEERRGGENRTEKERGEENRKVQKSRVNKAEKTRTVVKGIQKKREKTDKKQHRQIESNQIHMHILFFYLSLFHCY